MTNTRQSAINWWNGLMPHELLRLTNLYISSDDVKHVTEDQIEEIYLKEECVWNETVREWWKPKAMERIRLCQKYFPDKKSGDLTPREISEIYAREGYDGIFEASGTAPMNPENWKP